MSNDKNFKNDRKISFFINNKSLMEVNDQTDTRHQTTGSYNKKINLIINHSEEDKRSTHKEKYASFFWDMDDALFIADEIVTGRFKTSFYGKLDRDRKPLTASYQKYGGGKFPAFSK